MPASALSSVVLLPRRKDRISHRFVLVGRPHVRMNVRQRPVRSPRGTVTPAKCSEFFNLDVESTNCPITNTD